MISEKWLQIPVAPKYEINQRGDVRNIKTFVKYSGNDKPADFHVTEERGWLGSGVTDCNGVEIFEGDIVRFRNVRDTIFYEDGIVRYGHCGQLNLYPTEDLEVVGHIATEEKT